MANISSLNFSQLTDLIDRRFEKKLETLPKYMLDSGFVVKDAIPKGTGDTRRYAERINTTQYAGIRDEGGDANQAEQQYGYEKDVQVYTVALETSITKLMRDAGKDRDMIDQITNLSEVCPNTIDLDLSHRLTFAYSTSYVRTAGNTSMTINTTVGDGLAVASAVHTLTGSGTTYNNIIVGNPQFSKGALENGEKLFVEETYDNLGIKMVMEADIIASTDDRNTINQIRELLMATANIDSNNPGTYNVYEGKYKHVKLPRWATTAAGAPDTTKKKYWALISSRNSDFMYTELCAPYTKAPADGNNGEQFSSENWNYLTGATYGIGIVTPKWIKISK